MSVELVGYPKVKMPKFSAGESHVQIDDKDELKRLDSEVNQGVILVIKCEFTCDSDLFLIAFLADAVRKVHKAAKIILSIPYFPYARQDRYTTPGSSFTLKFVADFINNLNFERVRVKDPHSVVLPTLLNNCVISPNNYIALNRVVDKLRAEGKADNLVVVSPDIGAIKRSKNISELLGCRFAIMDKTRDPSTGQITKTEIYGDLKDGDQVIVVDDICDGGRTFIELAKTIRETTNATFHLFVTFGIFSKGKDVLYEQFETVEAEHEFWK